VADAPGEGQVAQEGAVLALHPDQAEAALEQPAPEVRGADAAGEPVGGAGGAVQAVAPIGEIRGGDQ
jgi:hypothetical protein